MKIKLIKNWKMTVKIVVDILMTVTLFVSMSYQLMHFIFFDRYEPAIYYIVDLLSIIVIMATLGYYFQKLLLWINKRRSLAIIQINDKEIEK